MSFFKRYVSGEGESISTNSKSGSKQSKNEVKADGYNVKTSDEDAIRERIVHDISGFDPTALERGAKAMKMLDKSPNADKALQLSLLQEKTKQTEVQAQIESFKRDQLELKTRGDMRMEEERRKTAREQLKTDRAAAEYKAQLDRDTMKRRLTEQQRLNEEMLAKQKAMFEQQERLKMTTERQIQAERMRAAQQANAQRAKMAEVEAMAKAKADVHKTKSTHALSMERLKVELDEKRKTKILSLETWWNNLHRMGGAVQDVITNPYKMAVAVGGFSLFVLAGYSSKMVTSVVGQYISARIGKPNLVRETSRTFWRANIPGIARLPLSWRGALSRTSSVFNDIVLPPSLTSRLQWIAKSTVNTHKHKAPFRHILLHGPPGTGKTLFAKKLAQFSGLDYAIITGGDFSSLQGLAVHELHKVFDWASTSRRGTILFIDEADAVLRRGRANTESGNMSENMRNVLNAFLHRTGTETNKFMIVMATNIPEVFDDAVLDRVDDVVHFPRPGLKEREEILRLYFNKFIIDPGKKAWSIFGKKSGVVEVEGFNENDNTFKLLAERTEGFSGRQLSKLVIAMQSAVFGGLSPTLTPNLALSILDWKIQQAKDPDAIIAQVQAQSTHKED